MTAGAAPPLAAEFPAPEPSDAGKNTLYIGNTRGSGETRLIPASVGGSPCPPPSFSGNIRVPPILITPSKTNPTVHMAMKLKLLELTDDKARILFEGQGNTYINALAAELINDPGVDVAQRKQAFRFTDPELVVTTIGGRSPLLAVTDAAKRLSGYAGELLRQMDTLETA